MPESRQNSFLDQVRIFVKAGDGGKGAMHFHREKFVPLGGPDGGDGGNGGNVVLRAERGLNTLFTFRRRRRFVAPSGEAGGATRMHGKMGVDIVVDVPIGTMMWDADTGEQLGDLTEHGQTLLVAKGGKGGLGNVHFKTSTNQAPGFAEKGEPGRERWLDMELKLIADIGIIGMPNAGKSTLLSVISAARPKIANYPFTTLSPNLGVVDAGDSSFVAADIPGLIEGAHEGVGLGHDFLRHIERTLVLLHLVDGSGDDPIAAFEQVREELRHYDASLLERPTLVVINKLDLPEVRDRLASLRHEFKDRGLETLAISAVTREGVDAVIFRAAELLREAKRIQHRAEESEAIPVIMIKRSPDYFEVERKRRTFHVTGETVERLAVMTDLDSDEALHRLQMRLRRMGVISALEKAGVREGSRVMIGDVVLNWDTTFEPQVKRG